MTPSRVNSAERRLMARGIVATTQHIMRAAERGHWREVRVLRGDRRELLERLVRGGDVAEEADIETLRALRNAVEESDAGLARIEAGLRRDWLLRGWWRGSPA